MKLHMETCIKSGGRRQEERQVEGSEQIVAPLPDKSPSK